MRFLRSAPVAIAGFFAFGASCSPSKGRVAELPRGELAVLAARMLDPESGRYSGPSAIIIRGGRIIDVRPASGFTRSEVDSVIDLGALTVLPGLIDAHVHLAIGGTVRDNANADLDAGFTTVVDLGSRTNRMLRIRDSINAGTIRGPRVLAAGRWVGTRGGVCEFNGLGIAGGPDAFRQRVVENAGEGADLIKVCVSGWPGDAFAQPDKYEISDSSLAAVVNESHSRGKKVIAHDISAGGVRAGLRAGIDGLAHTAFLDDALAADVARKRVFMITTLASLTRGDTSAVARELYKSVATAMKANVVLVFGTDGGVLAHGSNAEEFVALSRAGIGAADGIRSATTNAATALGIADSVGSIRRGMSADLIAVNGDPLSNVAILKNVEWVMLRGRVAKDRAAPASTRD